MRRALTQARRAAAIGEVPVGAVWVWDGRAVAKGHNRRETRPDPTAHAEMETIWQACRKVGRWRLGGTLYVTLEPCAMCAGALVAARITRLVFGADDPKTGACGPQFNLIQHPRALHRMEVTGGVCAAESSALLQSFFKRLRSCGRREVSPGY